MLIVNVTYNAETRLMKVVSLSSGDEEDAIATTGDNLMTRLQFTFDDEQGLLDGYDCRAEFNILITNEDKTTYKPYVPLDENNGVVLDSVILSNVKCGVLPMQLAFSRMVGEDKDVFYSLNTLDFAINRAIDSVQESAPPSPTYRDAIYNVQYDKTDSSFTFTQIDGTQFTIVLSDLSEEHYEVQHYADLITLNKAESGDTATVLDTGVWYKLYGEYDVLDNWYVMPGGATQNGSPTTSPVFYAPEVSGTSQQYLESRGENNSPEWVSKVTEITQNSDAVPTTTAVKTYADVIGNALAQEIIDRQNADATLENKKRDKITTQHTDYPMAYTQSVAGNEAQQKIIDSYTDAEQRQVVSIGGSIVARKSDGTIVASTPQTNEDVTTKLYVDNGLTAESTARVTADTTLQNNINSEATARATADTTLQTNINNEATARATADATLQDNINDEATARATADTTLQNNIDAEADTRASEITRVEGLISDEATLRATNDEALDTKYTGEITRVEGLIATERTARQSADTTLQSNITAEETRAKGIEAGLRTDLTAETTARENADITLQSNITAEETRAKGIEAGLRTDLTSESTARESADNTLQDNIDAEQTRAEGVESSLNTDISNEATARANADTTLQDNIDDEITARASADNLLQDAITNEASARASADNQLQANINTEAGIRATNDAILQSNIDNEEQERTDADAGLNTRLTAIEERITPWTTSGDKLAKTSQLSDLQDYVDSADSTLQSNIDSEEVARQSADTTLQTNIDSESATRSSEIERLEGLISAEVQRATGVENGLGADISTETSNRESADSTLQSNIDGKVSKSFSTSVFTGATIPNDNITANGVSVVYATKNTNNDSTGTLTLPLPVATNEKAGIASASQIAQIEQNRADINTLMGKSTRYAVDVDLTGMTDAQIQTALTNAWRSASGHTTGDPDQYTTLINLWNNHEYTWLTVGQTTQWEDRGISTVSIATSTSVGVVLGTPQEAGNEGNIYVDSDGSMEVIGWDDVISDIANAQSDITSLQNTKADKTTAVTNVSYDSSTKKIQKTINGSTTDVVTLSTVATSGSYNDLSNKPTIPTVNNGTLSIQGGGTEVASFTANQSGNTTLNIAGGTGISITNDTSATTKKITIASTVQGNVQSDWNATTGLAVILNKPILSTVATSGSYNDLSNKPTIPTVNDKTFTVKGESTIVTQFTANSNSDVTLSIVGSGSTTVTPDTTNKKITISTPILATVATSGSYNDLSDKPTIPTVYNKTFTVQGAGTTATSFTANSNSDVTLNIAGGGSTSVAVDTSETVKKITISTPILATVATSGSYNDLSNKPTIPTVNNATFKIQGGGTDATSFTANASSNVTLNIKGSGGTTVSKTADNEITVSSATLATVATSGSYNDLSDKPTIPTVNNATLTIQRNGTTVKTFTANASSDVTADITVPTKVSELTNDSGYTANTGTVTNVATGIGLTGGPITTSGTIKAKLKSETNATYDSNTITNTSNRQYAVVPDKTDGYLSVNVPWTDQYLYQVHSDSETNTYPILMSYRTDTSSTTMYARKTSNVAITPSTGTITASHFYNSTTSSSLDLIVGSITSLTEVD